MISMAIKWDGKKEEEKRVTITVEQNLEMQLKQDRISVALKRDRRSVTLKRNMRQKQT